MKLNDIDLNKLVVFMEVARSGGVTKAAGKLALTPSAVSQSIRHLEDRLDVQLFDRVGKKFLLSQQGQSLFQNMERYQQGLLDSLKSIQTGTESIKGQIRLGVFYGFSNEMLAAFIASLHEDHPDLEVDVIFGAPSDLDRMLTYKRLDFAINLFRTASDSPLHDTALMTDELWLVSSQSPPRRALDLAELRKAPFIDYYRKSRLIAAWVSHHFGKRVRDFPIALYASHSELVVQLILKGVGIGIVASSIAKPYVEAGQLFVIRGHKGQLVSPIWLKQFKSRKKDAPTELFRKRILSHFET